MFRREFLKLLGVAAAATSVPKISVALITETDQAKFDLSKEEWKKCLTPQQYHILRDAGTERPNSSPLNHEKRKGVIIVRAATCHYLLLR